MIGNRLSEGREYRLDRKWLIDKSFYADNRLPNTDELDYALLRVKGNPGNNLMGEQGSQKRGWIELPTEEYEFSPNTPISILQHPEGKSLKLAFDTDGIIEVNQNRTMVKYKTNTEPGSSGSPCFNMNWDLIALHCMGEENQYNAGTPFDTICNRFKKKEFWEKLRDGEEI